MAISLDSPTVRPPSSLDIEETLETSAALPSLPDAPTPQAAPTYQSPGPSAAGELEGPMIDFAQGALNAPSRYDSDIVQSGISLVNQEMERSAQRAGASQDEFYSGRGLVGSSVESQGRTDLLSQLEQQKGQRLFDLTREMANTYASDQMAASQVGATAGSFARNLGLDATNEARYGAEFDRLGGRDAASDAQANAQLQLQTRSQELQRLGMSQDEAFRYASLEQGGSQFEQGLGQRESEFSRQFGLSGQSLDQEAQRIMQGDRSLSIQEAQGQAEIGLRAQQLQQQAEQAGRSLTLDEARLEAQTEQFNSQMAQRDSEFAQTNNIDQQALSQRAQEIQNQSEQAGRRLTMEEAATQAEIGIRADQLVEERRQFDSSYTLEQAEFDAQNERFSATMDQQRDQFSQEMGLNREQLGLQRDQMVNEFGGMDSQGMFVEGDRAAERANRLGMQTSDQTFQASENSFSRMLEREALQLQRDGLSAEEAWRNADRDLDDRLQTEALRLEGEGMDREQAYRQALMQMDAMQMTQTAEIANQQAELSAHDIYLRALAAGAADEYPGGVLPQPTTTPVGTGYVAPAIADPNAEKGPK